MSRYTGPSFKQSRRVGFSTLENGKDLARRPYNLVFMVQNVKVNFLTTVNN